MKYCSGWIKSIKSHGKVIKKEETQQDQKKKYMDQVAENA